MTGYLTDDADAADEEGSQRVEHERRCDDHDVVQVQVTARDGQTERRKSDIDRHQKTADGEPARIVLRVDGKGMSGQCFFVCHENSPCCI